MCWACYTPFRSQSVPLDVTPQGEPRNVRRALSDAAPFLLVGALTASGWMGRRARWPVAGASVIGLGAPLMLDKWRDRKNAAPLTADEEADLPPAFRIVQTILFYVFVEKSDALRLRENGRGVGVDYRIAGQWHEQMKIPIYVWRQIRHLLLQYARQGEVRSIGLLHYAGAEVPTFSLADFQADLAINSSGETLNLRFESAPPKPAAPAMAPDVQCSKCHEDNAPGAVWCWNCYASLEVARVSAWREVASSLAPFAIVGALGSSGWWPRRARPFALGAGALGLTVVGTWCRLQEYLQEHFKDFKIGREDALQEAPAMLLGGAISLQEAPAMRLANEILWRALDERAARVRLEEHGNVAVSFEIGGEWRAEHNLPAYVWPALREYLLQLAREGFTTQGQTRRLDAHLIVTARGEMLELSWQNGD